jgi:hypothetical protein
MRDEEIKRIIKARRKLSKATIKKLERQAEE